MFLLNKPSEIQLQTFLAGQKNLPYSYLEVCKTADSAKVPGFDNDLNFIDLGSEEPAWQAAKEAIRQWKMFPGNWAWIWPERTPLQPGEVVVMAARVWGLWWMNSCRIVYVIDEAERFGFAYGTLPGHVELGEELFMVEKNSAGEVRYSIKAFSKPRFWMARLAYPVARAYQRKFVRESKQSMYQFVNPSL